MEPSLGAFPVGEGRVRPDPRRAARGVLPPDWRQRRWVRWAAGALAAMVLLTLLREPLADLVWPETRAQAMGALAEQALAENRLSADDGTGARELFEAALAIDPDRMEAHDGLMRVGAAALDQARAAIADKRFADAHRNLKLARELAMPQARVDAAADALRRRESAYAGLDGLVARADAARAEGRIAGTDDAALPLYRRVLELDPDRADALRARDDILAGVLEQARAHLRGGDLAAAAAAIDLARTYDGGHVDLPDTLARLTEETDAVRRRADDHMRRGRHVDAEAAYRVLLQLDPDDAPAADGLRRVGVAHAREATRLAADFEFAAAERLLAEATRLAPDSAEVRTAVARLDSARQAQARLARSPPTPERRRRVRALLAQAAAAEERGDLLGPPGESAFDAVRAARALAPDDTAVARASARLLPAARTCFDRELRRNNLGGADACLDARAALGDGATPLAAARRRLAQRWLAIGDERLGAGELEPAAAALAHARHHDPATPGLEPFEARLRAATASGD